MLIFLEKYGMLAIILFVALEYACLPLPSEVLLPISGSVAKSIGVNFPLLVLVTSFSAVLGAMLCYFIGRFGGIKVINLIERKFPKTQKPLKRSKEAYLKRANISTLVGRLIPICRTYISFFAGIYKQPIPVYMLTTFIGATIWNTILLSLGYYAIGNIRNIQSFYESYKIVVLVMVILIIIISIIIKEYTHKKNSL